VFDGTEHPGLYEHDYTDQDTVEAQAKADIEARQRHQMEQVYVRCLIQFTEFMQA
jgi:hypothetical protein